MKVWGKNQLNRKILKTVWIKAEVDYEETNKNRQAFGKDAQEKKVKQIKREHNTYSRD